MEKYKNLSGSSGVIAYMAGPDWIRIMFIGGAVYQYSYHKAGKKHVEQMKLLAQKGSGLATYISKYVKDLYDQQHPKL